MEKWQRQFIKSNLPELVEITSCNTAFLTRLYSDEILSYEEFHEINVTQNPVSKASKLYKVIMTRKNAYHLLIFASKETKQTEVVSILEDGELTHKLLQPSTKPADSLSNPNSDKNPLPETSTNVTLNPSAIPSFHQDLSGVQQDNLPQIEDSRNIKLGSTALPTSSVPSVEKTAFPEANDTPTSNVKGEFQFFRNLSKTPHGRLTNSLEKCHIEPSSTKLSTLSDKNADKNVLTTARTEHKPQIGFNTDVSVQDNGLSNCDSTTSKANINLPDSEGRTSLHRALADGQCLDFIKNLIDSKADYKLKDKSKEGALHFAVRGGHKEVISFLLSLKLDINEVDEYGETPLHKVRFTKSRDYLGMTTFLLNNGANLVAKDKNGNTVAHLLSFTKNISTKDFQIWVEGIISIRQGPIFAIRGGSYLRTPLQSAMQVRDLDLATFKLILESSNVDINQKDNSEHTLLHLASNFGRSLETIKNLISLGANIKIKTKDGSGVLHLAVIGGNKEVIQYLISQGLDINEKSNYGDTPLHILKETRLKEYVELTKLLLENGADLDSKDIDGHTVAHEMAFCEDVSFDDFKIGATAMIENGHAALFTIRGLRGRTALHSAMVKRDLDLGTIKLIIESAKLDINQPDDLGDTMLYLALRFGRSLDTIKSLVELGADWKKKGTDDRSVLHFAVTASNKEAFLYFKSLGADVHATNKYGITPLHFVGGTRSKEYLGMTKFLLENGANLNAKDNYGRTLDDFMSPVKHISPEDYGVWKEEMIQLGHAAFFQGGSN